MAAKKTWGLWFWHRWLGILASVVLLAAALSGSLLVYKKELVHVLVTQEAQLPEDYLPQDMLAELDQLVSLLAARDAVLIKAPNREEPYWTLNWDDGRVRLLAIGDLHPYEQGGWVLATLAFVRHVHTELLAGVAGEAALLVSGVAGLVLCITGIWLWWPTKRSFRWRWVFPWPVRRNIMLLYHRDAGIVASFTLGIILLTGSIMLWQKLVSPLLPPVRVSTVVLERDDVMAGAVMLPSQALNLALQRIPDGWPTYIRLPAAGADHFRFRFRLQGEWHPNGRTSVDVDPVAATLRISERSDQSALTRRLLNQLYPLHSSYGMNRIYGFAILASGVFLLWLCVTGFLSYLRQRRKRQP